MSKHNYVLINVSSLYAYTTVFATGTILRKSFSTVPSFTMTISILTPFDTLRLLFWIRSQSGVAYQKGM